MIVTIEAGLNSQTANATTKEFSKGRSFSNERNFCTVYKSVQFIYDTFTNAGLVKIRDRALIYNKLPCLIYKVIS